MDYPELKPVLERILEVVPARQIILFGSRARGQGHPDSDYDLLVVVPPELPKRPTAQSIHRALLGLLVPVDLVVAHPADLERYRTAWMTIYPEALKGGQVLYAA